METIPYSRQQFNELTSTRAQINNTLTQISNILNKQEYWMLSHNNDLARYIWDNYIKVFDYINNNVIFENINIQRNKYRILQNISKFQNDNDPLNFLSNLIQQLQGVINPNDIQSLIRYNNDLNKLLKTLKSILTANVDA